MIEASGELSAKGGKVPKLTVLTWDEEREAKQGEVKVQFVPLWEWLLETKIIRKSRFRKFQNSANKC